MNNTKATFLARPAIQHALASLAALMLTWPIIQIPGDHGAVHWFVFVFVVWSLLVLLLGLISRALLASPGPDTRSSAVTAPGDKS